MTKHLYSVRLGEPNKGPQLDVFDDCSVVLGYGVGQAIDLPAEVIEDLINELENVAARLG